MTIGLGQGLWRWTGLLLGLSLAAAAPARAADVALTFDDAPHFGKYLGMQDAREVTARLLAGLRRNHLPAIGFVNEIQLTGADREGRIGLLSMWLDAGMDLGNHSYSHLSLTNTPVDAYIADVARGEAVTSTLLAKRGRKERWYRHPYLETGATREIRERFEGWLAAHGYRVAPVSMENSDWQFADPYDDAIARGDTVAATHIRDAYLAYTAKIVPWYQQAAKGLLGRQPSFVFLLHASRLNADTTDRLAAILRQDDLHAVTIDRAMRDPAYKIPDTYYGPDGKQWLTRWSLALRKPLPWSTLPQVPADIAAFATKAQAAGD